METREVVMRTWRTSEVHDYKKGYDSFVSYTSDLFSVRNSITHFLNAACAFFKSCKT